MEGALAVSDKPRANGVVAAILGALGTVAPAEPLNAYGKDYARAPFDRGACMAGGGNPNKHEFERLGWERLPSKSKWIYWPSRPSFTAEEQAAIDDYIAAHGVTQCALGQRGIAELQHKDLVSWFVAAA
jgi:hypothetical protein